MATCPQCGGELKLVRPQVDYWMNRDQFDATKAGDCYCETCPDNGRGKSGLCYWWWDEIETHQRQQCDAVMRL